MAGSGHLQTFRLLRYLRGRSSAEGQVNYGLQMAVSIITVMNNCVLFKFKTR